MHPNESQAIIAGSISYVLVHNEKNGYTVMDVIKKSGKRARVVGFTSKAEVGQYIQCEGKVILDPKFGEQFKADTIAEAITDDKCDLIEYLSTGIVNGVGPGIAKRLGKAFGSELRHVLDKEPERMITVDGIGKKKVQEIGAAWKSHQSAINVTQKLMGIGLSVEMAVLIQKKYGNRALKMVEFRPYSIMLDIRQITFQIADMMGFKVGIGRADPQRVIAGLIEIMKKQTSNGGHTYIDQKDLIKQAATFLRIQEDTISINIMSAIHKEYLTKTEFKAIGIDKEGFAISLSSVFNAEQNLCNSLLRIIRNKKSCTLSEKKALKQIAKAEKKSSINLGDDQKKALMTSLRNKFSVITGGPGVGKTSITKMLVDIFDKEKAKIKLCSPTGRAAKVLSNSTNREAKTIHRTLIYDPNEGEFVHNSTNLLDVDVLIVDEFTMVSATLADHLFDAIPDECIVVLIGDIDQISSIGAGDVFADIIHSGMIPVSTLKNVYRQAKNSMIIKNSQRINSGEMPRAISVNQESDFYLWNRRTQADIHQGVIEMFTKKIPNKFGFKPLEDIQIITMTNKGENGVHAFNQSIQKIINPKTSFNCPNGWRRHIRKNDKVIQTVNDYELGVYNGDIGYVTDINTKKNELTVWFDGQYVTYNSEAINNLSLAYAITIHKAQGSEFKACIIVIDNEAPVMQTRDKLYTALTRAKELALLTGNPAAIRNCVETDKSHSRNTMLGHLLKKAKGIDANYEQVLFC